MDIITDHTASAAHGIGADTTAHTGAHITALTGVHGHIVHGAITVITTRGDMQDIGAAFMTHGITEAIGEDIMAVTGAGMTHGTTTITTAAGMTHITTIIITQDRYISAAAATEKTDTQAFVPAQSQTVHSQAVIQVARQTGRQVR